MRKRDGTGQNAENVALAVSVCVRYGGPSRTEMGALVSFNSPQASGVGIFGGGLKRCDGQDRRGMTEEEEEEESGGGGRGEGGG